ncbi:TerB family tellurite resistance protein [Gammaproteobacteria bacterium]|jgi:uncharacterized tellurite resistance protein B-like protein|nr:TerB family tellurite resistance protein [Gammaproteobacteria bacterium]
MIGKLKTLFEQIGAKDKDESITSPISKNLITAALMVEVMQADFSLDEREQQAFISVLKQSFDLNENEVIELEELAHAKVEEATSLYEFTRQINDNFSAGEKLELIRNMWRVAFADGEIDRYEDGVIRRVAELIYVAHSDFIRMKLEVKNAQS